MGYKFFHKIRFSFGMILILLLSSYGCVPLLIGAAVGAGSVEYIKGKLTARINKPVSRVYKAGMSALKKMDLIILDDEVSRHEAMIKFKFDDGKKGVINIKALTEHACNLSIRIGFFGDETKSNMILTAIKRRL